MIAPSAMTGDIAGEVRPGPPAPVSIAQVQSELRGRDLACWCPLDQPCHADVLLELANGEA